MTPALAAPRPLARKLRRVRAKGPSDLLIAPMLELRCQKVQRSPRVQQQLLRAPVQQLSDIELVLGWTRDLVNPAELLERLPRPAEPAEHAAVERELVDPPGI